MGFSGRLEGISPSDIFQIISQNRMTGTLIARCPDGTFMVVFSNGQVIETASDAPLESLGSLLVSQGAVSETTIAAARELRRQGPDRPLGAVLIDMGAIDQKALEAVVLKQIGQIVQRLISCEDGFFTFDHGEVAVKRKLNTGEFSFPSGLSPEFLIMERARAADEERRKGGDRRASSWQQAAHPWDGIDRRRTVTAVPPAAGQSSKPPAAAVLRRIADTAARTAKQAATWTGGLVTGDILAWCRQAGTRLRAFSPHGKALIYAGLAASVVGIALFFAAARTVPQPESMLLVTGRIVNVRISPQTESDVVAKVERGATVAPLSFHEGWYRVRTGSGDTGYVWHELVEKKVTSEAVVTRSSTGMTGAGVLIVTGLTLIGAGVARNRIAAAKPPRILRVVK